MATPSPAVRLALASRRHALLSFTAPARARARARAFSQQQQQQQQPPPPPPRTQRATTAQPTLFRAPRRAQHLPSPSLNRRHTHPRATIHTTPPTPREPRPQPLPPPTDFALLDVLAAAPTPPTAVQACLDDGFALGDGTRAITGGDGALLVAGQAFVWRPWEGEEEEDEAEAGGAGGSGNAREGDDGKGKGKSMEMSGMGMGEGDGRMGGTGRRKRRRRLVNERGQWEIGEEALGVLGLIWPRPDLLILGVGPEIRPLSPATRRLISSLGMRVEVLDTRNAASQYNMLATERGVDDVAAALIPIGWKEGEEGC